MFNNALKHISSGISKLSSSLSSATQKVVDFFPHEVEKIISHKNIAANDELFHTKNPQNQEDTVSKTNNIIDQDDSTENTILSGFSGVKVLTLKNEKIKLVFQQGKIKKAIKNVNGNDVHLNAKAIRKITKFLQTKSTQVNRVSYSTRRNVKNNTESKLNKNIHGGYTYINEAKTQFSVIINRGKIIKIQYANTQIIPSIEEIKIIQSTINNSTQGLSNHKNARQLKKEMQKKSIKLSNHDPQNNEAIKLQGTKKHNEAILAKQKREKIKAEKREKEQYRLEKESHMEEDYKTLFRYQTALSKCNSQGEIINGSDNIAEVVLKVFAARKGITGANFQAFLNSTKTFEVFKKVIKNYLTIDSSFSSNGQSNRNSLFNIFMNASEIYSKHLYIKNRNTRKKKKSGPNIFDAESINVTDDLKKQKDDWVNKYYPNEEAA